MEETKKGNCKYTPGVDCFKDPRPCSRCGWNPRCAERRLKKIKEARQIALRNGKG